MTTAAFSVSERNSTTLVHDPATGLTHRHGGTLPDGRITLDPQQVARWPTVAPRAYPGAAPISVCWSPLVRCNLTCPHCLDDKTIKETPPEDRARIARLLAAARVLGVDISGGEPLLLKDLPALADTLARGGCAVSVTTNGWHLRRRAEELATHLDAVRVSLDGPTARSHDAWRGDGSFSGAVDGIRAAVAAGVRVQIQTVLMASTSRNVQQLLDLAAELGTGGVTFLQMLPIGVGARLGDDQALSDAAAAEIVHRLTVPPGLNVRLRTRADAGGFTVVRADGWIWRNDHSAERISTYRPLRRVEDLALTGPDGSALNGGARRVFEHRRLWQLTPTAYQVGTRMLAEAALSRLGQIDTVIGIANGGRAPAYAIAAIAGAAVVTVSARHNADDAVYTQATGRVSCEEATLHRLGNRPGPFLVIDDICGTGATLAAVTETLAGTAAPNAAICTATLCRNRGAIPGTPDLHVWDVADWVVFPWERVPHAICPTPLALPTEVHRS